MPEETLVKLAQLAGVPLEEYKRMQLPAQQQEFVQSEQLTYYDALAADHAELKQACSHAAFTDIALLEELTAVKARLAAAEHLLRLASDASALDARWHAELNAWQAGSKP